MSDSPPSPATLLAVALDIGDAAERRAYLDRACAGDAALRAEVESLLAANSAAGDFLLRPAATGTEAAQETVRPSKLSETAGTRIGRYKLLEPIGEGGFGVVWMAEQEEPVRRRVALKIIKLGMDTKEVVARFEAERQALAMMDHPHIASVFDGGATDTGRPYFVMELVKGIPITDYCDAVKLSTRERLDLFMQVCQAVQHAHQKGIIHRDLKPSNILVTVKDDRAVPKVIDFGIAKATQARLTQKTVFTRLHQWIGTPAYMSPEQAGLGSLDVDTRSDVYSLGVLLYELLIGRTPFDTQKLLAAGYDAVMRTIREEEPPKPSTRLSTLADEELSAVAAKRGAEPAKLGRVVRGDLDWIVMKALEKDRTRRYDTANDFARDLERHLESKPVSAAAPSLLYLASKFVRRNRPRLAFATLAVVTAALAVTGIKLALRFHSEQQAFQATGTNAVFTLTKAGDAGALARLLDADPRLVNARDATGSTPLIYAAGTGGTNALSLLIAHGAAVDATNHDGLTALGNAANNNRTAAALMLLAADADPNHADASGATPLHAAATFNAVEVGRVLLAKGARTEVFVEPSRLTPLSQAALVGQADFVDLLLAHHASVGIRDLNGHTPLHFAATGRRSTDLLGAWKTELEKLANRGPASEAAEVVMQQMSNRIAALEKALPAGSLRAGDHPRVALALLAKGAALEATNHLGRTPLLVAAQFTNEAVARVLIAHQANLNARDEFGSSPLNLAAYLGSAPLAELLLQAGANPDLQDDTGFTPLNTAAEHGHIKVAHLLLTHRANPNLACPDAEASTVNGQAPMHSAASRGDVEMLRLLLDQGASLNAPAKAGTPLIWAVRSEHAPAVEFLLQRGAQPNCHSIDQGLTPLHWAAILGQPELVSLLLKHGASNNLPSAMGRPLHTAAMSQEGVRQWLAPTIVGRKPTFQSRVGSDADHAAVIRQLLASGADVNGRDLTLRTPLMVAVRQGNVIAVETLLAAEADVEAAERLGFTALQEASESDAPVEVVSNIVIRLIRAGAPLESRDLVRRTPLHQAAYDGKPVVVALLLEAEARINAVGPDLRTPLLLAVVNGHREVVELLLARRANTGWHDASGCAELHYAAQLRAKDIARLLLENGAEVDIGSTGRSGPGTTALMISASLGDVDMIKLLLEHGAQIDRHNQIGWTPLVAAAEAGRVDAATLLLERGASLEATGQEGATAFIRAAKTGQLEMVKFLLEYGAKLDARDLVGFTALHEAADRGYAEVAKFLISRGAEVNARSDNLSTPLHNAATGAYATNEACYVAVVKVLLAHGADANARMHGNQTPLHRAAASGHPQILQVLLAAGADANSRDDDGKTALDLATAPGEPRLPPAVAAGRKQCADLLRGNRQPQKPPQDAHPPAGERQP
jgi:ankyrin repeat protein/serine/threonine protein kinase